MNGGAEPNDARPGSVSRRSLLLGGAACAACALGGVWAGRSGPLREDRIEHGDRTQTKQQRASVQPEGLFRVDTDRRVVALSFDDGPDPRYTPHVLDLLHDRKITATFFNIGVNAMAAPDLVKRVLDAGHTIGNHTYDHRELELLTPIQVKDEIERGQRALIGVGVPRPTLFRPPKGFTDEAVGILADAERYRTVFWDACLERFVDHDTVEHGVATLLRKIGPGSIILAHDGGHVVGSGRAPLSRQRTMEALPRLLAALDREGYEIVDVPTLVRLGTSS